MTNTATISPPMEGKSHGISDIRAVRILTNLVPVDLEGAVIVGVLPQRDNEEQRGWVCLKCEARFGQWEAVEAHLEDPPRVGRNTLIGRG